MKAPFRRNRQQLPDPAQPPVESEQPTTAAPAQVDVVTQADPETLDPPGPQEQQNGTGFGNKSKLRRRLRYLRRAHELGLRDLGGLVFDLHRFGKRNDQLVVGKLMALETVDKEMRSIERALGQTRDVIELREPGITACARCGTLHGTDARFCPSCGTQVDGLVAVATHAAVMTPAAQERPIEAPIQPPAPTSSTPPVPATGPAPAAPPLWSVPQPEPDQATGTESPPTHPAGPEQ